MIGTGRKEDLLANFVLALDNNPVRRTAFLKQARSIAAPVTGLKTFEQQLDDLAMIWWLGEHAPWSEETTPDSVAVLAGHAINDSGQWLNAAQLRERWATELDGKPSEPLDAYHVAAVYEHTKRLIIAADLLGFFPVYYWHQNGVLLATSSCKLLAAHPAFDFQPDLQGIAGMLMANGLVANRTLVAGVRRLSPGHRLIVERSSAGHYVPQEQFQYRIWGSNRFANTSFSELVEIVDAAMRRIIQRHTPSGVKTTQLVSGGLDSRIVTGYIQEANIPCTGICLGKPHDFEALAAADVAEVLGFPFRLVEDEVEPDQFIERAKDRLRWLNLSAGIGTGELTDADTVLQQSAPCYWSGMSLDSLLGGLSYDSGYNPATGQWSFTEFVNDTAKWGMPAPELIKLLQCSNAAELVEDIWQSFNREYYQHKDLPHRLVFHSRMYNRHRYHLGNTLWQLSFFSWPLLFIADHLWLQTIIDIPPQMIMGKRLEKELLRKKFPQLLSIPIDVNSWHHGWIDPSWLQRCRQRLNKIIPVERAWNKWYWRRWCGIERQRYWRFYDFDGPKWHAVRQFAEPLRGRLDQWLNRAEVDRLLPSPQAKLPNNNSFSGATCRRNLLGLAIWLAEQS